MRSDQRRQFISTASKAAIAASEESRAEITAMMAGDQLGSNWRERRAWVAELFLLLDRLELLDEMMAREPEAGRFAVTRDGAEESEAGFKQLAGELLDKLSMY